ncbi:hypothetical protein [Mesorhizobium sp.]|nr:hypothetical protein [Mesorhizobium sp.]
MGIFVIVAERQSGRQMFAAGRCELTKKAGLRLKREAGFHLRDNLC